MEAQANTKTVTVVENITLTLSVEEAEVLKKLINCFSQENLNAFLSSPAESIWALSRLMRSNGPDVPLDVYEVYDSLESVLNTSEHDTNLKEIARRAVSEHCYVRQERKGVWIVAKKIFAIRQTRTEAGCTLKEARDAVEEEAAYVFSEYLQEG